MKTKSHKIALFACSLAALINLYTASTAKADTVVMGSDRNTGGEGAGDRQTMNDIMRGMRNLHQ